MRMLRLRKVFLNWNRKVFWKNSHSWISLRSFAEVPISMISLNLYSTLLPSLLANFCLINAKNVWFWFFQIIFQVFFIENWSDSIYIPWWNEEFIWSFPSSIGPIFLIGFSMSDAWTIAELFGSGLGDRFFLFNKLFGEEFGLFFLFLFDERLGFLMIFFGRHLDIIIKFLWFELE